MERRDFLRENHVSELEEMEEFPEIYIQPPSQEPLWSATPLLLFFYFLIVYGGFLSFTIANTVALWVETGVFQFADPVLVKHSKSHQWEPTYESFNRTALFLHGAAAFTMFSYPPEKKTKYDFIHQPIGTFFLLFLFFVWDIYSLVSNSPYFTSESLQTAKGIFIAQTLFRGLILTQSLTTFFLIFYRVRTSHPFVRLPESFSTKFFFLFYFLPLYPCYFLQYAQQQGSLFPVLYFTIFYGFAYLKLYMDQR